MPRQLVELLDPVDDGAHVAGPRRPPPRSTTACHPAARPRSAHRPAGGRRHRPASRGPSHEPIATPDRQGQDGGAGVAPVGSGGARTAARRAADDAHRPCRDSHDGRREAPPAGGGSCRSRTPGAAAPSRGRQMPTREELRPEGCGRSGRDRAVEPPPSTTATSRGRHGAWISSSNSSTACCTHPMTGPPVASVRPRRCRTPVRFELLFDVYRTGPTKATGHVATSNMCLIGGPRRATVRPTDTCAARAADKEATWRRRAGRRAAARRPGTPPRTPGRPPCARSPTGRPTATG